MNSYYSAPSDAWELLAPMISEERRARMHEVLRDRTDFIRLVVQDVHHPHNVSACLRSAEAFGIQFVDIVALGSRFSVSSVAKGVGQWLSLTRHNSIESCVKNLRAQGYRIATGMPSQEATSLDSLPVDQPIAVVFGNERQGIHDEWLPHIDMQFTIPMCGMVESLNISVSAAITLHHLTMRARKESPDHYPMSQDLYPPILNDWAYKQFKRNDKLLERLRQRNTDT